jgi:hypothetical protein
MRRYWSELVSECERVCAERIVNKHVDSDHIDTTDDHDEPEELKAGASRYKNIVHLLTSTRNISLMPYQLLIAKDFIRSCIPKIYGEATFRNHGPEILESHNLQKIRYETFVSSARRVGKTLTTSMCMLAIALSVPAHSTGRPFQISVYSVTKNSSKAFISECLINCRNFNKTYTSKFYIKHSSEEIRITNRKNKSDVRIIRSHCGRGDVSI